MKTAAKISMTALATVLCFAVVLGSHTVQAQESAPVLAQPVSPSAAPVANAVPGPTSTQVSSSVKEALDSISVPGSSSSVMKDKVPEASKKDAVDSDSSAASADSQAIPESVKGVVKKLNETTENVTLENLNEAREAVVKLDVLIDIEKRLNDLTKLRQAREEDTDSISRALPQSALPTIPLRPTSEDIVPPAGVQPIAAATFATPPSDYEVVRVVGASGNYAAQIRDTSGSLKLVRVGDRLTDGSKVNGISIGGVSMTRPDKTKKTFSVKDAPAVFGTP